MAWIGDRTCGARSTQVLSKTKSTAAVYSGLFGYWT